VALGRGLVFLSRSLMVVADGLVFLSRILMVVADGLVFLSRILIGLCDNVVAFIVFSSSELVDVIDCDFKSAEKKVRKMQQ
jgi:hypothetical protein